MNFLCAGNQLGKSTIQIRKAINWATEPSLWPELWIEKPTQFWYLYPTNDVSTIEFREKWEKQILPRGMFKKHPQYGWRASIRDGRIFSIEFESGVTIYFKSYSQRTSDLQTGTCFAVFCDEEIPEEHLPELRSRLRATNGYFHMVFTATLGQEIWRRVIEDKGDDALFPEALKLQVSMFDCKMYEDGTPSMWTDNRINKEINNCATLAEVDQRIHGKFVKTKGLKFPSFTRQKNIKPGHIINASWSVYAGIDIGSGGDHNHPAAIVFVSLSPSGKAGRVFRGWRGDGIQTTALDILDKYIELSRDLRVTQCFYDGAAKDFAIIAQRRGVPVIPAEKGQDFGTGLLNSLFKNEMLIIYDKPELEPLVHEITVLQFTVDKSHAKDDFCDALRYCCSSLPWDFADVEETKLVRVDKIQREITERRQIALGEYQDPDEQLDIITAEIEEANYYYDGY